MHELGIAFDRISNQARFIKMIIDRELIISNRKRKDIVDELRAKKFTPYPKQREKKRPGEVEIIGQDEEEEENVGGAGDYDYLLSMQISSLTVERMEQLLKQRDSKEEELNNLAKLQPQDLWNVDLDKFMEEWEELLERDIEDAKKNGNKSKNKGATAKRIQKAIKKKRDDDDDDDDFSAAPKRKKASPVKKKTQPKKEDKDNIDDIEVTSKTTKKAPAKKHKIESDEWVVCILRRNTLMKTPVIHHQRSVRLPRRLRILKTPKRSQLRNQLRLQLRKPLQKRNL